MPASVTGDDEAAGHVFTDYDGDLHLNGGLLIGAETEGAAIKAIINSGTISVTVPSIGTAGLGGTVAVDVSALTFACAVGDQVIATPIVALPTNCYMTGAYVSATDTITVNFEAIGGTVTGAAKNFNFLIFDLT